MIYRHYLQNFSIYLNSCLCVETDTPTTCTDTGSYSLSENTTIVTFNQFVVVFYVASTLFRSYDNITSFHRRLNTCAAPPCIVSSMSWQQSSHKLAGQFPHCQCRAPTSVTGKLFLVNYPYQSVKDAPIVNHIKLTDKKKILQHLNNETTHMYCMQLPHKFCINYFRPKSQ